MRPVPTIPAISPDPVRVRRARLSLDPNPCPQIDYLVTLTREITALRLREGASGARLELRYVPDRCTLSPVGMAEYLELVTAAIWLTPEALATAIFDDLINEIVPRWLTLELHFAGGHAVRLEDRQPQWDNPSLLARLAVR